ncbi:hypothetical protein B0T11DRAFT_275526 [Plectosphaerella cucumerina]|uniref:Uncharacterized protein n=1 Tax=Plectosphaerella cucumerina TaxID=40658 RepID=A0A8K0THC7_9PEZI|nr:hypothetical protein B0T11DRAFT_275526 [Plectosphaerella cucumerina]
MLAQQQPRRRRRELMNDQGRARDDEARSGGRPLPWPWPPHPAPSNQPASTHGQFAPDVACNRPRRDCPARSALPVPVTLGPSMPSSYYPTKFAGVCYEPPYEYIDSVLPPSTRVTNASRHTGSLPSCDSTPRCTRNAGSHGARGSSLTLSSPTRSECSLSPIDLGSWAYQPPLSGRGPGVFAGRHKQAFASCSGVRWAPSFSRAVELAGSPSMQPSGGLATSSSPCGKYHRRGEKGMDGGREPCHARPFSVGKLTRAPPPPLSPLAYTNRRFAAAGNGRRWRFEKTRAPPAGRLARGDAMHAMPNATREHGRRKNGT